MTGSAPLAFDRGGEGPPVVMLHGLGGTSNSFQALMGALSGFTILRPDLPGAGRSPLLEGALTLDRLLDAVTGFLDAQGLARVALAGHSLGTLVAQHLAARSPERVSALVLFGALTEPPGPAREGLQARAAAARAGGMTAIAEDIVARTLAAETLRDKPVVAAFVRESLMRQPPEGYARMCEALASMPRADAARIAAPVLLVTGESDPVSPPAMARELADLMPHARAEILPSCGHWTPVEKPATCGRLAAEFLTRHAAR
ncbi:MAG: alpha/beta fold hydrolase [Pararhodobacter sp.]